MKNLLGLRSPSFCCALACAALLSACGDQASGIETTNNLLPPVALRGHIAFVDATHNRAFLLDAGAKDPQPAAMRIALPFGPTSAVRRNGATKTKDEALVLCAGRRSTTVTDAEPASLVALESDGDVRRYDLGATPFDRMVQADDGRFVVLFHSEQDSDRLINNANELVIVDLDAKPGSSKAVTHKTPPSFGHTPQTAVFSPAMQILNEERRLLVVLSEAEVTLIDLSHLERRDTVVQLGGQDHRSINPEQVLFGDHEPTLYIRGRTSNDIFVFELKEQSSPNIGGNDFHPSINQLNGGQAPRDMALFSAKPSGSTGDSTGGSAAEPKSTRLLVLSEASRQAIVIDPSSSKATPINLSIQPSHVLLFEATSPSDKIERTRALIYGENQTSVVFLDLDDIETKGARNVEELALDDQIAKAIPLLEQGEVVLMHPGRGVSMLDLAQRTVAPINSDTELTSALFDSDNARLWVGPAGQSRIGTLDIGGRMTGELDAHPTLQAGEILLDAPIEQLIPLFDAHRMAVLHPSRIGYVTLLDADEPSRDTAVSLRGFLIEDVLDRGEK